MSVNALKDLKLEIYIVHGHVSIKYTDSTDTSHAILFYFYSVLRPFQDYFSSYETGQSVGGRKWENPEKNHLAHPQAELGLSHMWPLRARSHTRHSGEMIE